MNSEEKRLKKGHKSFKSIKIRTKKNKYAKRKRTKTSIINTFLNLIINSIKNIIEYFVLGIPFFLIDYYIREETKKIRFRLEEKYSYIFSYAYIIFYVLNSKAFKGNIGKIYYSILFIFYFLLFLTNIIYYSFAGNFFYFKLLSYASEGSHFIIGVLLDMKKKVWINALTIVFCFIIALIIFRKPKKNNFLSLIIFLVIFIFTQIHTEELIGPVAKKKWNDFEKPRNIFKECTHPNKCMKIAGFYKYIEKDFFKTYLNFKILFKKDEKEELEFLKNMYKDIKMHEENEYTGRFKDKNIILVQMEGMDDWLLNEENTPTLYSLKKNSFDFTEHYSYDINEGKTFNSEFCVNTGFHTPLSISANSYDFYKNTFNSLPKMFKKLSYTSKSFHFNKPEFYHRDINYLGWGYEKFLSLIKTKDYRHPDYASLDTELINNKKFYEEIFNTKGKFLYYFITFSIHLPFSYYGHSRLVLRKKFGNKIPSGLKQDDIMKVLAGETDEMVKILLEGLKKNNLYDNTVLILFADHATNCNKRILSQHKITKDHRIDHTPFLIWSANMKGEIINKTNCQLDILPTILNLFGIPYQEQSMIGRDIFDKNNLGFAFFDDYSWIDGKILVNHGKIIKLKDTSENDIDNNYISNKAEEAREKFRRNDLTLKYDYLKNIIN